MNIRNDILENLMWPKPGFIIEASLLICGEIELICGQFGETPFQHIQRGFFNHLFICLAFLIQSEAEFDYFLTGFKYFWKVGEGDFGVFHAELLKVGHLDSGLHEHLCWEPVGVAGIKSNY